VLVLAVQNSVEQRVVGTATSAAMFMRSIGGSFGVAVFGTVFANRVATEMSKAFPGRTVSSARRTPAQLAQLPPPIHEAYITAYSHALHDVFLSAIPLGALAFVLTLFLKEVPLRTEAPALSGVVESFGGHHDAAAVREEVHARTLAARAALDRLDEIEPTLDLSPELLARVREHYQGRIARLEAHEQLLARAQGEDLPPEFWSLCRTLVEEERDELARLREEADMPPASVARAQRDLDAEIELVSSAAVASA
jgi:hypothetical protein